MIPSIDDIVTMVNSYDVNFYELRQAIVFFVQMKPRDESVILFYRLMMEDEKTTHYYNTVILDILDQMCGYCGYASIIGTGDYDKLC